MSLELIVDSHYKSSIFACRDYLVKQNASNIGFELPDINQYMLERKFPIYRRTMPSIVFDFNPIIPVSSEFLQEQRRASPKRRVELEWQYTEKISPHVKLFMLLAGSGLSFKFFCYDVDEVDANTFVQHRIQAHKILVSSKFFYVPNVIAIYNEYARDLDFRDRDNVVRIQRHSNENTHIVSGAHHAPFLHGYLQSTTGNLVVAKPDEYQQPDFELILRLRANKVDEETAANLVRKQRRFLLDARQINFQEGIPGELVVEHKLRTISEVYEELFPDLSFKYP